LNESASTLERAVHSRRSDQNQHRDDLQISSFFGISVDFFSFSQTEDGYSIASKSSLADASNTRCAGMHLIRKSMESRRKICWSYCCLEALPTRNTVSEYRSLATSFAKADVKSNSSLGSDKSGRNETDVSSSFCDR